MQHVFPSLQFRSQNPNIPVENTSQLLSTLALLCRVMIESVCLSEEVERQPARIFCSGFGRPLAISPPFPCVFLRLHPQQPDLTAKFRNPETIVFCQRVMVGTIILYDHVHHAGAFSKKNQAIDVSRVGGVQR